jgi:L-rhamnose-H+ transport protein
VLIFTLAGVAGSVFYLPFRKVKGWAWETYWLIYALAGLVVVPWVTAYATSPNVLSVLRAAPRRELVYCYLCGAAWGFGGLTWGLMIRYLGVGLGLAIGCGICSAAGTIVPPILNGNFGQLLDTNGGRVSLLGVVVSVVGIVFIGIAGMSKEREQSETVKKKAVAEFDFKKGLLVAVFAGLASSAMNFGLQGGPTLEHLALTTVPTTSATWKGMPVLLMVYFGGFTVNCLWCLGLNVKNKTLSDYAKPAVPRVTNMLFAVLAGALWCSQTIFLKAGEPAMGAIAYVGWAVVNASTVLFSALLGLVLGEWKGTSARTSRLLVVGFLVLLLSSLTVGVSGYLRL